MDVPKSNLSRLLAVIPAIILITTANVLIGFTTAGVVLLQLLALGTNKYLSLIAAILVAIGVHAYIVFNHKLRAYIKNQGELNE